MKLVIVADLHFQGKILKDKTVAWDNVVDKILEMKADRVNLAGDVFHKSNIADREASMGTIYRPFMDGVNRLTGAGIVVEIDQGNHDMATGDQKSALEPIKDAGIRVVDTFGQTTEGDDFIVCHIPWIADTEERQKNLAIWLTEIKRLFRGNRSKCKIVVGHIMVKGAQLNSGVCLRKGSFEVDPEILDDLGADVIAFGDIHKRQRYYVGAMSQNNFGEEGNPQGFMVVDTEKRTHEFIEIAAPQYRTIEVEKDSSADVIGLPGDYLKVRYLSKPNPLMLETLQNDPRFKNITIEIVPERVAPVRQVEGVEAGRSDADLLDAYLKSQGRNDVDRARIAGVARELAGELR
ncbi:MAG: metallophosphoesterase [Candidatus Margulisiibacteriota bacterium]